MKKVEETSITMTKILREWCYTMGCCLSHSSEHGCENHLPRLGSGK